MRRKALVIGFMIAFMAAVPAIATAKRALKGDDKLAVATSAYYPGGKTTTNETVPPKSFLLNCLNVDQSTVNGDWAGVTYRYPWALQHRATCPARFLGNGLTVLYAGKTEFWERTVQGPYDDGQCPTGRTQWGPRMPYKVGRDLFGKKICP